MDMAALADTVTPVLHHGDVGLLAVDITPFGIVMSSDSQDVTLIEGGYNVAAMRGQRSKEKIQRVRGKHFAALLGYVGTEMIGADDTSTWLKRFVDLHHEDTMSEFCEQLATELSSAWREHELDSCLWVFLAGHDSEARFWYVVNLPQSESIDPVSLTYVGISREFRACCDLDDNYLPSHMATGLTKDEVLQRVIWYFRNGVLLPAAEVSDAFTRIIQRLVLGDPVPGFPRVLSLETYAYAARQRLEFVKRLYKEDHGIYAGREPPPIDGEVFVYSVEPDGTFRVYPKIRAQAKIIR
jgi:hypothetical protein